MKEGIEMDYIKCSEVELNALHNLVVAIENVESAQAVESDVKHDLEVTNGHNLNDLAYDIKNNDIYKEFISYNSGFTKVTAYDSIHYTGAQIIECDNERVFGYYVENDIKIFFISKVKENEESEDEEENDYYFYVENTKVFLNNCMRI